MKSVHHRVTLILVFAWSALAAQESAQLRLERAGSDNPRLRVTDPENRRWIITAGTSPEHLDILKFVQITNSDVEIPILPGAKSAFFSAYPASFQPIATTSATLAVPTSPGYQDLGNPPATGSSRNLGLRTIAVNDDLAHLGRVLFYDKRLSAGHTVSCASCHQQEHAFADDKPLSVGHAGVKTRRNTPSLGNQRSYYNSFFWDGRARTLELAVMEPILHADEMGMSTELLLERAAKEPYYEELFARAFPGNDGAVNATSVSLALAEFLNCLVPVGSRYDEGMVNRFVNFTDQERRGRALFEQKTCARCHSLTFSSTRINRANIGLENPYQDGGFGEISLNSHDDGVFKIPNLRNIALTAPYMHDGRFATLEEVIAFYADGMVEHPNRHGYLANLSLNEQEQADLVAFLKTLTADAITREARLSDPFKAVVTPINVN